MNEKYKIDILLDLLLEERQKYAYLEDENKIEKSNSRAMRRCITAAVDRLIKSGIRIVDLDGCYPLYDEVARMIIDTAQEISLEETAYDN